ncbi:methyltransferase domain-containing protein [Bacillus aerolatus]|uniref:Methyltransferase domain-containing protein n=1 Tax=Bacillus aerolatus TaxID=2653354 RepID=A0A6I1FG93_9BACI|nr:class I SAM-dependent methyltransferase [Bacillus aerolatus]KAB7707183.1 methyltransferase domain-containing protein [Bacillus aerolatus]
MAEDFQFNSEIAAHYEAGIRQSLPTYDQLFKVIQSFLRAKLKDDASILVIGAGGGKELSVWAPANPKWTLTGVDPSEDMLNAAKQKVRLLNVEEQVQFIQGTVSELTETAEFDAATCLLVLHFIHDQQEKTELLKTAAKHLKPNAPFVLVTMYGDPGEDEFKERMNLWKSFWLDAGTSPAEVDEMANSIMNLSLLSEEKIKELLADAGFMRITRFFETAIFGGWICYM